MNIDIPLSIMKGTDERKINLDRNIIKNSFNYLKEDEINDNEYSYYLYH